METIGRVLRPKSYTRRFGKLRGTSLDDAVKRCRQLFDVEVPALAFYDSDIYIYIYIYI